MTPEIVTVLAWQEAANVQDVTRLLDLSSPAIVIVGPRGRGAGHQLLRDWLSRAGLMLHTLRTFQRGDTVVVAQRGTWQSEATQGIPSEAQLASRFRVQNGQVIEFERYPDLASALAGAKLGLEDEHSHSK